MEINLLVGFTNEEKIENLLQNIDKEYIASTFIRSPKFKKWLKPYVSDFNKPFEITVNEKMAREIKIPTKELFTLYRRDIKDIELLISLIKRGIQEKRQLIIKYMPETVSALYQAAID